VNDLNAGPLTNYIKQKFTDQISRGTRGMHIGYRWASQKERAHQEDQDVGGWTILKWILERQDAMEWIGLEWLRIGTSGRLL
jgi:hypothetical protein